MRLSLDTVGSTRVEAAVMAATWIASGEKRTKRSKDNETKRQEGPCGRGKPKGKKVGAHRVSAYMIAVLKIYCYTSESTKSLQKRRPSCSFHDLLTWIMSLSVVLANRRPSQDTPSRLF